MTDAIPLDDLGAQAREGWRLGARLCTTCGGYHQVWGLLRAAGVVGGPLVDRAVLGPLLSETVGPKARVLIAGAADAGLLQLMAETAAARPLTVIVIDLCPAPLALIGAIDPLPGITVWTRQGDLTTLTERDAYDLILSHSMLGFLAPGDRLILLRRLRDALKPDGRLALTVRTAPPVQAVGMAEHDDAWLARAQGMLSACPDLVEFAGEALEPALARFARHRARRLEGFSDPAEVTALLENAGLAVERHQVSGESTALTLGGALHIKQSQVFLSKRA